MNSRKSRQKRQRQTDSARKHAQKRDEEFQKSELLWLLAQRPSLLERVFMQHGVAALEVSDDSK